MTTFGITLKGCVLGTAAGLASKSRNGSPLELLEFPSTVSLISLSLLPGGGGGRRERSSRGYPALRDSLLGPFCVIIPDRSRGKRIGPVATLLTSILGYLGTDEPTYSVRANYGIRGDISKTAPF